MAETITLQVTPIAEQLPDADTDVILFTADQPEGFVGAYIDHDDDKGPVFCGTNGETVVGVVAWSTMPRRDGDGI